jgi:hypothetical protein
MNKGIKCCVVALTVVVGASISEPVVSAQDITDRGWIYVSGVYPSQENTFTDTVSFTENFETGTTVTPYTVGGTPGVDVMGGVRVWQYFGVGAGVTQASQTGVSTTSTTRSPHPLYFNRHRTITGPSSTDRTDTQVNIHAMVVVPAGRRVRVTLFGGPTLFQVKQELVTSVSKIDGYPFNTPTFQAYSKRAESVSSVGFNAGADVAVYFSSHVGVGGMVRYSVGTADFSTIDGDTLTTDVGGLHVGGGLRLKF